VTPDQFKTFRREHDWSQREISELLGYGLRRIGEFENGDVEIPLSVELACCALALGLRGWPK
jgi:hypothetical protein